MASATKGRKSVSGTAFNNGIISLEEYNRKLTGLPGLKIYDEMRRSDGTTSAALRIVKLPLQSAKWEMRAASEDEQDQRIRDVVQHNLEQIGWNQILQEILTYFDFGYSVFEMVLDVIPSKYGDYVGISELGSIKQSTINKWEQKDGSPGILQQPPTGPSVSVPIEDLIIFTNDKEGQNYEGKPLLRPAYKHWYMKESLYKIDALAHEKQGLGIPNLKTPAEANSADLEKAREIAQNIYANEAAFSEMPEGYELSFLDMKASTTRDPMNSVDHHTVQIMKSVLAQFLELSTGGSDGGSNALSSDHSALFMKSEETAADYIKERMKLFIKKIVDINFPNAKALPTLEYSDLNDTDTTALAVAVQRFMVSGAMTPDPELERHLRKVYDLPDLPDEIANDYDNRIKGTTQSSSDNPKNSGSSADASLKQLVKSLDNYIEANLHESKKRRTAKR